MTDSDSKHWRDIAEQASKEADSDRLLDLARQLERALDEDHQQRNPRKTHGPVHDEADGQKAG